jgi:hypothetical protein
MDTVSAIEYKVTLTEAYILKKLIAANEIVSLPARCKVRWTNLKRS